MEIKLEKDDNEYINRLNEALKNNNYFPVFVHQKGEQYYIQFTVVDVAKANNFILSLMSQNKDYQKTLEDATGIHVDSFNFCNGDTKIGQLKDLLHSFIEALDHM